MAENFDVMAKRIADEQIVDRRPIVGNLELHIFYKPFSAISYKIQLWDSSEHTYDPECCLELDKNGISILIESNDVAELMKYMRSIGCETANNIANKIEFAINIGDKIKLAINASDEKYSSTHNSVGNAICIGDLNGGDYPDFVVAAPSNVTTTGTVYILYGSQSIRDINGDRCPDLVIAAPDSSGEISPGFFSEDISADFSNVVVPPTSTPSLTGTVSLFYGAPSSSGFSYANTNTPAHFSAVNPRSPSNSYKEESNNDRIISRMPGLD
jgi:FG-GAP repeat